MDIFAENSAKYFFIKCKHRGELVLDVNGGSGNPGTAVILFHKKSPPADNQLWCYNAVKRAIFSKLGNLCMDVDGHGHIVINHPNGSDNQQWLFKGDNIVRVSNNHKAIDINGAKYEDCNHVLQWDLHNQGNQQFVLEFQPTRLFYIKSAENEKVLDVEGENRSPGARCCLWHKKPVQQAANQLFYEDHVGLIRSNLTHFLLDCHDHDVVFKPFEPGNPRQRWCFHENHIVNADRPNEVLSASHKGLKVKHFHGDERKQQWLLEYV